MQASNQTKVLEQGRIGTIPLYAVVGVGYCLRGGVSALYGRKSVGRDQSTNKPCNSFLTERETT